ncbi:MAG: hypothetical protein WBA31_05860 [Candidatus Dormiibacterota bacterium]
MPWRGGRRRPLNPKRWYLSPVPIIEEEGKPPPVQARQGDIFNAVPSVVVERRPLRVARDFIGKNDRTFYTALSEDDQPEHPFDWDGGEQVVVTDPGL